MDEITQAEGGEWEKMWPGLSPKEHQFLKDGQRNNSHRKLRSGQRSTVEARRGVSSCEAEMSTLQEANGHYSSVPERYSKRRKKYPLRT